MTSNKAPKVAASEERSSWTITAVRNFHIIIFAISAVLGAYLVYTSSFPASEDGEPAPLWPYEGILLAFLLVGTTISIGIYMDEHKMNDPLAYMLIFDGALAFAHFFIWLFYGLNYSWDTKEVHPYPSIWLCYLVVGACTNIIFLAAFMPITSNMSEASPANIPN
ncbi:hypothetical protein LTR15_006239 [Elasticomyces elasticus]|nr:hypothetical protein LTR15_006239 [Elasticomyces elasticus]